MKRAILSLAVLFFMGIIPGAPFAGEPERPENGPTATQPREQYEKSMEERLGRIGRQLDELKAKAAGKTEQAREEMKQLVADAEKKREAASRKLEEMRRETKNKWRRFVSDMNRAADDFEQAFERARSRSGDSGN